jgi:hypothetical protein
MSPQTEKIEGPEQTDWEPFNCIVDESALIAGVKAAYLKDWVIKGDIRIFLPLQSNTISYEFIPSAIC